MKKKSVLKTLLIMVMLVTMVFGSVVTVQAATMDDPVQTPKSETSFAVQWKAVSGAASYYVLYYPQGSTADDSQIVAAGNKTSYTFTGLPKDTVYYVGVVALDSTNNIVGDTYFVPCITKPGKMANVKVGGWDKKKVQLVAGNNPYPNTVNRIQYQILNSAGKKVKEGETDYTTFVVSGVPATTVYKVRTRWKSVVVDGKSFYGDWSDTKWLVPQPIMNKLKIASGNKIKVSWKKVKGATKYIVYGSTDRNKGYKKIKAVGPNKTSLVVSKVKGKKLKKYKTYYFKVVAMKGTVKSDDSNIAYGYIYTTYK